MEFEHTIKSVADLSQKLQIFGVDMAVIKELPKNANDKNQIYLASSFTSLHSIFDLKIAERGVSTSEKTSANTGSKIPEAVFSSFEWLRADGSRVHAKNAKVIVYTQYPEARLSGLQSVENTIPQCLLVSFTKSNPDSKRLLILGRLPGGACLAIICLNSPDEFISEIRGLPGFGGSRICKHLVVRQNFIERLMSQLAGIVGRPLKGSRLDKSGQTLPFNASQVCGYTLEHALGIVPNSDRDGDLYGIELKTHTQSKVSLFTPEPDFGLYATDWEKFMLTYGYPTEGGNEYRLTGIHKANERCSKSGLTLKVREYRTNPSSEWIRDELAPV